MQLGMQNGQIANRSLTASTPISSVVDRGPQNARLHFPEKAWIPDDVNPWLQVDFSVVKQITVIATQGREEGSLWVRTYKLSYTNDSQNYMEYEQGKVWMTWSLTFDAFFNDWISFQMHLCLLCFFWRNNFLPLQF